MSPIASRAVVERMPPGARNTIFAPAGYAPGGNRSPVRARETAVPIPVFLGAGPPGRRGGRHAAGR